MSSAKWRPFCLGLNVLTDNIPLIVQIVAWQRTGHKSLSNDWPVHGHMYELLGRNELILICELYSI